MSALCFETGQYFERINEENSTCEAAIRSYQSADGLITVQLIGVNHMALPTFYDRISQEIKDKVVIFEQQGHGAEEEQQNLDKAQSLGAIYEERYRIIGPRGSDRPTLLGLVNQSACLSYGACKKKIPGDSLYSPYSILSLTGEMLKGLIDCGATAFFKEADITVNAGDDINEKLKIACSILEQKDTKESISNGYRFSIQQAHEEISALLQKPKLEDWPEGSKGRITIQRNNEINKALESLWITKTKLEIAVVYGSAHLLPVEQFLLENGFVPIKGSDEWLTVAKLEPASVSF